VDPKKITFAEQELDSREKIHNDKTAQFHTGLQNPDCTANAHLAKECSAGSREYGI